MGTLGSFSHGHKGCQAPNIATKRNAASTLNQQGVAMEKWHSTAQHSRAEQSRAASRH